MKITVDQNFHLDCRPTQISQVLVNLINNSFEAIQDLPEKWIEIHAEIKEERLLVMITDSGKGIPEAAAEKVMEPFLQPKKLARGAGLGLSVAKGIIESHGGTIQLDRSSVNTRFVIDLPIHQADTHDQKLSEVA